MIVTLKIKSMICAALVCAIAAVGVGISVRLSTPVSAVPKVGKTIVVDAGHGGEDGGVCGSNTGVKESEINLAVAKSLRHFLIRNGYDVVMTRENGEGLYGLGASNKKLSDMQARRDVILSANADLVVSVHQNYYPRPSISGSQVFYAEESEKGKEAAQTIQTSMNAALTCSRSAKSGDYYMVKCTSVPSVIVECGFLSNAEEERLLVTAAYQERVAYAIYSGIVAYLAGAEG